MVSLIKKKNSSNKTNKKRKSNFKKTGRRTKMSNKKSLRRNRMKHGGEFDDKQTIETLKKKIEDTELAELRVRQLKKKILEGFNGKVRTLDVLDMLSSTLGITRLSFFGSGTSCTKTKGDNIHRESECRLDKVILYTAIKEGVEDIQTTDGTSEILIRRANDFISRFNSTFGKAIKESEAKPTDTERLSAKDKRKRYWAQQSKFQAEDMIERQAHTQSEQKRMHEERNFSNSPVADTAVQSKVAVGEYKPKDSEIARLNKEYDQDMLGIN